MLLAGAYGAQEGFGGAVPLAEAVVDVARSAGSVVLTDDEGAPVAEVWASGGVSPVGRSTAGEFPGLHRLPSEVAAGGPSSGVLLRRPLLAAEVSALAEIGEDGPVLLLVRTVDPEVPDDVLLKATLAAARQIPSAQVVTVPFAPRDDSAADIALGDIVLGSFGAVRVDVLAPDTEWRSVRDALGSDDDAALVALDPGTRTVLRQWRPRRSERGLVVFFTGLSGSGKSTVARALVERLHEIPRTITVLDGDVSRRMLSSGLGFSREDRDTNIRRLGWVAAEVARHGGVAVLAPIAPFATTRAEVRRMVEATGDLVLVWVSTPLEECERRDRKGLYARARRGEIADFTGVSSAYESPEDADLIIDTTGMTIQSAVEVVWTHLEAGGWLAPRDLAFVR